MNSNQPLTQELLYKLLEMHLSDEARKQKLGNYYIAKQDILYRTMSDASKPNNRIANGYGNYITDTVVGYFMGEPVSYAAKKPEFEPLVERLKEILEYNDEQAQNVSLAKDASKFGVSYELLWLDRNADVRFNKIDAIHAFPIYENSLENNLLYFVRYYNDDLLNEDSYTVELYDSNNVTYFHKIEKQLLFVDMTPHNFGDVPVVVYFNNEEELGDYELVLTLIDNYDKLTSDSVNDFEAFADAYLTLKGMDGTEPDDIAAMKESRVLLLPEDGEAAWLVKTINDTYFQNTINTIYENIHKFSKVPDMMDEAFGSNLSGIAIKYKLMGLENKISIKESYFRKGLQRRIELINNILTLMGDRYEYMGVDITFRRNIPINELEAAQLANAVNGIVSDETAISLLPFVKDAAAELEKRDNQISFEPEPIITENFNVEQ